VSGVGLGIHVLDGVHVPQGKGGFWGRLPPLAQWFQFNAIFCNRNVGLFDSCMIIFPHGQYIVGIYVSLAFWRYTQVRGRCWGLRAIDKNVTVDIRKLDVPLHGAAATSWRPLGLPTNF